ncbi:MAG: FUSC family protein [Clostridia bacterium]|nr:FUSC family protein [Clostridia bacterium]
MKKLPKYRFTATIGVRSFKTAFTCLLCAILYMIIDRNPTFACIGVIFGMGSAFGDSKLNGGNRLIGTIIGGFLGMILFRLYLFIHPDGHNSLFMLPFLFVGVLLLILCSQIFYWPGAVQPGGVVLCIILYNTPVDQYVEYSLNRMLDTGIGVAMALVVAALLPKDRVLRILTRMHLRSADIGEDTDRSC